MQRPLCVSSSVRSPWKNRWKITAANTLVDPHSGVAHAQHRLGAGALNKQVDASATLRLHSVPDQIHDNLFEARRIAIDANGVRQRRHGQRMTSIFDEETHGLHGTLEISIRGIHRLFRGTATRLDERNVEEVIDQPL